MEICMKFGDFNKYDLVKNILVFVFVGGCGLCLYELIDKCVKLVFYFGGNCCIIDFVFFNCINLGLNWIGVVI